MKAIIHSKYGDPNVLQVKETPTPKPNSDEVLVKIIASTINRTDCAMLRAKPFIMRFMTGLLKPTKTSLGTDFAGVVEAVGAKVTKFKIGDKVFGFNDIGLGSHAQYITIKETHSILTKPVNIYFEHAAASTEGFHYAYNMINKIKPLKNANVIVNGATGAIGSAAVQLLKYYGANVTAVCKGEHAELVKSIGAKETIDYTKEDFTKQNKTYSCIFDCVGKSSFSKCKSILDKNGVYISSELGAYSQNLFLPLITKIKDGKRVIFPFPTDCKRSMVLVRKLMEESKFLPIIDKTYTMAQVVEGFTYVESGQKNGNVILSMK